MFVCICNAVTDRQIQETVAAGAATLGDLQAQLGVATCCGSCSDLAASFLNGAAQSHNASSVTAGIKVSL
ncbi:(2Fe-2S)-binding protein [Neisseria leonii]|uniref:Bacterioferritin-associated ferredoxin n=1 Tax=Neisseria leonii TaxID=2995413 RepID=A0A9X4IAE9_9NEIS|nr:(2Fe-2S)-binding protein [Neisseria sp. 51.81]MDD9327325.1 (2Fe-2S)-binding protein [Neisseria sp. 51.81]